MIHTAKGFSIVNEADVFLEFPCFLYGPTNIGNLIFVSSEFSKSRLYIWKFSVHILKFAQIHVHLVGDAIQPSHLLSAPSSVGFQMFKLDLLLLH